MRPLKPYVLALGGFIAAVFGAVFLGAPPEIAPTAPASGPNADVQAKRTAPSSEVAASRDAKAASKPSAPDSHFPLRDDSRAESPRVAPEFSLVSLPATPERIIDLRQRSLVGVIELRI